MIIIIIIIVNNKINNVDTFIENRWKILLPPTPLALHDTDRYVGESKFGSEGQPPAEGSMGPGVKGPAEGHTDM